LFEIFIDHDTIGLKGSVVSKKIKMTDKTIILPVWFPLYLHVILFLRKVYVLFIGISHFSLKYIFCNIQTFICNMSMKH